MPCSRVKQDLKTNPYLDAPAGCYCGSFEKYCRFVLLMLAVLQCCILNCWVRFHLPALSSVLTQRGEVSHSVCICAPVCVCLWFSKRENVYKFACLNLCGPVCVPWFLFLFYLCVCVHVHPLVCVCVYPNVCVWLPTQSYYVETAGIISANLCRCAG